MERDSLKISGGYILICLIWGSTWLAIRIGLDSLTPLISAGLRFVLASVFIYLFMVIKKITLQTDRMSVRLYLIMSLFSFAIPFSLVYWAEQYISSGLASVLFAIFPFFVILFSKIMIPADEVDFYKIAGSVLAFTGIVIIFWDELDINLSNDIIGMVALIVSATMQAFIAVMIKKYGRHLNPLSMNFLPFLLSGIILVATAFLFEDSSNWIFNSKAIISISYLAFFGSLVTFTTYFWLMKRMSVVILALSSFITPIIAVILGWIILDESFSILKILGSSLVLIGILFANFKGIFNYYRSRNNSE
ncbi:MAG: EamA family transporter [bacterium]